MKRKIDFTTLVKNSFIIGLLIKLADFLYGSIPNSKIGIFLSNYGIYSKKYSQSITKKIFSRFKIKRGKTLEQKKALSFAVENSLLYNFNLNLKEKLFTTKVRAYGAFLFAFGFVDAAVYTVKHFAFRSEISSFDISITAACAIISICMIFSKKPMGKALFNSLIIGKILREFVGVRRDEIIFDTDNNRGITLAFMTGILLGGLTYFVSPLYIILGICGIILMALIISKPEFGILFLVFALPFLPTMALCALTLFTSFAFFLKVARGKRTFKLEACDVAVALFMLFIFLGGIFSVDRSTSIKSAAVFISFMLNYFLISNLMKNRLLTVRMIKTCTAAMFVTTLIGLYQKFFAAAVTTWHDTTMFSDIGTRIYSTFDNPNVYGEYLVMTIPLVIALLFTQKNLKTRVWYFIVLVSSFMALVYTQSRGAWLAFILACAIYLLIRTGKMLVVYLLGIFAIPILPFVLPQSIVSRFMSIGNLGDSSTSYRVAIWEAAVKMIKDFFVGGIGIGTTAFSKIYPAYSLSGIEAAPHSHQLFFQIIIEMGIFALISLLVIIFMLVRKNSSALLTCNKNAGYTLISSAALCGVIGMLIQGLTDYVWYNYRVFGMFWIMIGICVAAIRCAENEE